MTVTTKQTSRYGELAMGPLPARQALAGRTGALLAAHVPLSLLLDIADPCGPNSHKLYVDEPATADWLVRPRRAS